MNCCPLSNIIKAKRKASIDGQLFSEHEVRIIMRMLVKAVNHIHQNVGVTHRDLKPENIVIGGKDVKIVEFGNSEVDFDGSSPPSNPEEIETVHQNVDDMWQLGLIMYQLFAGFLPYNEGPFTTRNDIFKYHCFNSISKEAIDLMKKLLIRDQTKRTSSEEALNHDFF